MYAIDDEHKQRFPLHYAGVLVSQYKDPSSLPIGSGISVKLLVFTYVARYETDSTYN